MLAPPARSESSVRIAASKGSSAAGAPARRQRSEQYFTFSQSLSHFFRQVNERPHAAHGLLGRGGLLPEMGTP